MSFFSVGMNLTRTFCSCAYLSLKAESCALKSNSYIVCAEQDNLKAYSFKSHPCNSKRNKATAYPPSSLMGNNKNTRLLDPQKRSSFLVSLQNIIWPKNLCFWSQKNEEETKKKESFLRITFSKKQSCWNWSCHKSSYSHKSLPSLPNASASILVIYWSA